MSLRLCIIGAGAMGARIAEAADRIDGVEVIAVVDRDAARSRDLAERWGAQHFSGIEELPAAHGIDAAYIGVPHDLHRAACVQAMNQGLHVLVDKPLCNTQVEAEQILAARDEAGVRLMVGFSYRYRAEWIQARQLVSAGAIGTPRLVVDTLLEASQGTPAWYWSVEAGGGVLQLQSHHCFDRLAWVLGDSFTSVSCRVSGAEGFAEDTAIINGSTAGGALVSIDIGFGRDYSAQPRPSTVIQGDSGQIVIDHGRRLIVESAELGQREFDHSSDDWLHRELSEFAEVCAGSRQDYPAGEDGRVALGCALAAGDSARADGTPVGVR